MAKKTILTPQLIVLPDTPDTNDVDAAAGTYEVLTPKFAGYSVEESVGEADTTTSEDDGVMSYIESLSDFTCTLSFRGGDTANDYSKVAAMLYLKPCYYILIQNKGAISAENVAIAFLGRIFSLPFAGTIGEPADFDVTIRSAGGGVTRNIIAAATITSTYTNAPVT